MKNFILSILLCSLWGTFAYCVEKDSIYTKKNSIYFELGGKGVLYSVNYDRTIPIINKFGIIAGTGLTYISLDLIFNTIRFQVLSPETGLYYGNKYKIEIAYSKALLFNYTKGAKFQNLRIGYRYQNPEGGLMYRLSYCPIYTADWGGTWFNWGGISVGYCF